ncbi:hypothetical protein C8Q70DRAFT_952197 [Cubamyces menziesii]|nr:hypothetical protein C8Q70DRAFT_952197 [Cubamyces menziesii]
MGVGVQKARVEAGRAACLYSEREGVSDFIRSKHWDEGEQCAEASAGTSSNQRSPRTNYNLRLPPASGKAQQSPPTRHHARYHPKRLPVTQTGLRLRRPCMEASPGLRHQHSVGSALISTLFEALEMIAMDGQQDACSFGLSKRTRVTLPGVANGRSTARDGERAGRGASWAH